MNVLRFIELSSGFVMIFFGQVQTPPEGRAIDFKDYTMYEEELDK